MTVCNHKLNRFNVEMVKPDKCIRGYAPSIVKKYTESTVCDNCIFCAGNECVYETVSVELAKGTFENTNRYDDDDTVYFEQFCCPECGELIKREGTSIITWGGWGGFDNHIKCDHCKTEYVALKNDHANGMLTIARKPK